MVVIGAAALAGGVLPFAPREVVVAAALVAALGVARTRRPWTWLAVVALAMAIGALRASSRVHAQEGARTAADLVLPRSVRCAGRVTVDVSPVRMQGALRWGGPLREGECEGAAWAGRVTLYGGPESLARGDEVAVVAQLAPPTRLWNEDDPRPREARQASVRSGGAVDVRVLSRGVGVLSVIDRARSRARSRIDATFPEDVAPMARALVLGESDLAPDDDAALRGSGLAHLLAVSGMHLVIAVASAVAALRALLLRVGPLAARVEVGRVAAMAGLPLVWTYAELAGGGGSTRRAAWMLSVSFVARALGRRPDAVRAFGGSLVAMALVDALVAYDASFLLSAAATAGLIVFARPLATLGARWPSAAQPLVRSAAATIGATLPCAPILARFAPTLPLGGVLANLLAVPLGESVALPLCLLHAVLGAWPGAERGCALAASGALRLVRLVARRFAGLTILQWSVPAPTSWQLVVFALAFATFVLARRAWRAPLLALAAAALLVTELDARRLGRPEGVLRVTFLDVGQGDAALIDLPDGSAALIDGGGLVGSPVDTGTRVVAPLLRARRRTDLSLAVLSHPHPDHFGGLATGLAGARVGAFWDTGQGEREGVGGSYATLRAQLRARGVPILTPPAICGERLLGGARLDVLAPCPASLVERGPNDNSIALRFSFGRRAVLFVGDAEREEEADLVRLGPARLGADVLKVGHHGSLTSSSPAFLAAVAPREAVISVGARNRFGHPGPATLAALAAAGARVWRTDRDGAVTVVTDGEDLRVDVARTSF